MADPSAELMGRSAALHDGDDENHTKNGGQHSLCDNPDANNSILDYDDFPLEEYKEDTFDTSHQDTNVNNNNNNNNHDNDAWVQLLNLPPTTTPVGGIRRVSSCYFSIASNLSSSNDDNHHHHSTYHSPFVTPNPSYHSRHNHHVTSGHSQHQHHQQHYDALSFDGRNASDFLLHDVLMNVFSFLDAHSLAAFSETARRPNFECFYFLELQLQRALLMGKGCNHFREEEEDGVVDDDLLQNEEIEGGQDAVAEGESDTESLDEDAADDDDDSTDNHSNHHNVIPSFDGSIAGTGVISRLASLDGAKAREIVQTYLDSNASIHAMPLSHSLAYFREVLMRGGGSGRHSLHRSTASTSMASQQQHPPLTNIPENMAKNARNMALVFTFLGAAYMHAQQGGEVPPITMPDPSEVLNEENMEALKGMMLKVGLAGGFFKAGKTMKEKAEMKQNPAAVDTTNNLADRGSDGGRQLESVHEGEAGQEPSAVNVENDATPRTATVANGSPPLQARSSSQRRSASLGSLEDLSHMMHLSAIASRLYNAFSNNNGGSVLPAAGSFPNMSTDNLDSDDVLPASGSSPNISTDNLDSGDLLSSRPHRGKRSHETFRHKNNVAGGNFSYDTNAPVTSEWEETKSSEQVNITATAREEQCEAINDSSPRGNYEEQKLEEPTPEAIAFAMDHPFSPNPYEHPSSSILHTMGGASEHSANDAAASAAAATSSFFSSNMKHQESSMSQMQHDEGNVPTGCIGAYAHAVKTTVTELTRLIKSQRKSNFDALSPAKRLEQGIRFIDACTSDDKLPIVKRLLPCMDVDRFFIGPDDTETCALHAAAFNGAEKVLRFLCGGIDESDPSSDRGLCDVNVRDANGWTALHFAAGANSVTSVRVLAGHGAKLTIEASNGYTPFHWAERLSNEEVAAELEKLGADNRFVGRWMFGSGVGAAGEDDRKIPFVSFLANQFFAFSR